MPLNGGTCEDREPLSPVLPKVAGTLRVPSAEAGEDKADGTRSVPATLVRPVNGYVADGHRVISRTEHAGLFLGGDANAGA
jgi:hypothetical protein